MSFVGSNVDVIECTIRNNTSALEGGGVIASPNNASGINCIVNIEQSLIDSNTGLNGGGIFINGNQGFGNNYTIDFNVENSTVSNNLASSASGEAGGGAIWCKVAEWTTNAGGDGTSGNINLNLVHATVYNNSHAAPIKGGLRFTGTSGFTTTLSAYNSIIVSADDTNIKAISFANANLTEMVNCILGGLNASTGANPIIDDAAKNNLKAQTATQAGLTGSLTNNGGSTQVLAITEASFADDFCTTTTGISLPTTDQRGYTREGTPDAGAYEFGGTLSTETPIVLSNVKVYPNPASEFVYVEGINQIESIEVFSVLGVLEKTIIGKNYLDTSELSSGIYLLVIKNNSSSITKRLVVN